MDGVVLSILAIALIGVFFFMVYREMSPRLSPYAGKMLKFMMLAVMTVVTYFGIAPYFVVEPTGEVVYIPANTTIATTTVVNGTTTTTAYTVTATRVSPVYRPNPAASAWGAVVLGLAIVMVIIAMYFMFMDVLRWFGGRRV